LRKAALAAPPCLQYTPASVKKEQIRQAAEAVVEPGEVVEVATTAMVGSLQLGRQVAIGIASAIATVGLLSVTVSPKAQPLVLTTKRLLVLGMKNTLIDQADSKIKNELQRAELRAKPARRIMLYHQVDVTDDQGNPVARIKFGFFDGASAQGIAQGLGPAPVTPKK
jgi:hypothetical protein